MRKARALAHLRCDASFWQGMPHTETQELPTTLGLPAELATACPTIANAVAAASHAAGAAASTNAAACPVASNATTTTTTPYSTAAASRTPDAASDHPTYATSCQTVPNATTIRTTTIAIRAASAASAANAASHQAAVNTTTAVATDAADHTTYTADSHATACPAAAVDTTSTHAAAASTSHTPIATTVPAASAFPTTAPTAQHPAPPPFCHGALLRRNHRHCQSSPHHNPFLPHHRQHAIRRPSIHRGGRRTHLSAPPQHLRTCAPPHQLRRRGTLISVEGLPVAQGDDEVGVAAARCVLVELLLLLALAARQPAPFALFCGDSSLHAEAAACAAHRSLARSWRVSWHAAAGSGQKKCTSGSAAIAQRADSALWLWWNVERSAVGAILNHFSAFWIHTSSLLVLDPL